VTPENIPQFELLIQDHRSIQRLADMTLNDEHVVTAENANQLLEAMRKATIEEEKAAMEATLTADRQKMNKRHRADMTARREAEARADAATSALAAVEVREQNRVNRAIAKTNRWLAGIDIAITALLLCLGTLGAIDWVTGGQFKQYLAWKIVAGGAAALGLYHLIAHVRGMHILGTTNFLNWLGRRLLATFLGRADVEGFDVDKEMEFTGGRARRKGSSPSPDAENFHLH